MDYWGSLLCALLFVIQVEARTDTPIRQCKKINSCACSYDDGSVVDLHQLARNDGTAAYVNVSDGSGTDFFFWNPCSSFSLSDPACHDVAVCMVRRNNGSETFHATGRQESANFNVDINGNLTLVYNLTEIHLECSTTTEHLTAKREQSGIYQLSLASKYACPFLPDHRIISTTPYNTPATTTNYTSQNISISRYRNFSSEVHLSFFLLMKAYNVWSVSAIRNIKVWNFIGTYLCVNRNKRFYTELVDGEMKILLENGKSAV